MEQEAGLIRMVDRIGRHVVLTVVEHPGDGHSVSLAQLELSDGFSKDFLVGHLGAPVDDIALRELLTNASLLDQPVESYLVLGACTDYLSLNKILNATADLSFDGCILTKIDEAAVLGPASKECQSGSKNDEVY